MLNLWLGWADRSIHNCMTNESLRLCFSNGYISTYQEHVACSMPHRPQYGGQIMIDKFASSRVVPNFPLHRGTRRTLYGGTRTSQ